MFTKNNNNRNELISSGRELVDLYNQHNFIELANRNLDAPIDEDGNTIIHKIAENLDRDSLERIREANPHALNYEILNKLNKKSVTPMHHALKVIIKGRIGNFDFITFLKELGADPTIPDEQGHIIVQSQPEQAGQYGMIMEKNNLKKLNENVIDNIKNLAKMAQMNTEQAHLSNASCSIRTKSANEPSNKDLNFIIKITNHYFKNIENLQNIEKIENKTQQGGYSGTRKIKSYYSTPDEFSEFGENDSFVTKKRNQLMNMYSHMLSNSMERPRREQDQKASEAYNNVLKKIIDLLGVDEELAKLYRVALKIHVMDKNPELRKRENDAIKVKEMEEYLKNKETLQKVLDSIDIKALKKEIEARRKKREEERAAFMSKNKSDKKIFTPSITTTNTATPVSSDEEKKPKKKVATKKKESKVVEKGYLQSDEILLSPGY